MAGKTMIREGGQSVLITTYTPLGCFADIKNCKRFG